MGRSRVTRTLEQVRFVAATFVAMVPDALNLVKVCDASDAMRCHAMRFHAMRCNVMRCHAMLSW